ncbi:MAG: class I SAM-dependent methyltransferase [Dehalococcoidales bacterium]|nr:class I SAM-dependent methyltransferase [Dehalococcoidales bacterium]
MTDNETLKRTFEAYLEEAAGEAFYGWNFDYVVKTGRMIEAPVKWNYYNVVLPRLAGVETMLDMGTGGGEILSTFKPLPPVTCATEQYQPNVPVARERLEPLGVKVFEIEEEKEPPYNRDLPFDDNFFDLIINRHEAYYPPELKRILKPGGHFITQQVANANLLNLMQFFLNKPPKFGNWNLMSAVDELTSSGFEIIEQQEDIQHYRFYDVGAIAYFLKVIPWTVPGFTIDKYRDRLWDMHLRIDRDGYFDTPRHRILIIARK